MRYVLRFGTCYVLQNVKQCYVLRDRHSHFGYYAVKRMLRFALSFYVLGNVTFSRTMLVFESNVSCSSSACSTPAFNRR